MFFHVNRLLISYRTIWLSLDVISHIKVFSSTSTIGPRGLIGYSAQGRWPGFSDKHLYIFISIYVVNEMFIVFYAKQMVIWKVILLATYALFRRVHAKQTIPKMKASKPKGTKPLLYKYIAIYPLCKCKKGRLFALFSSTFNMARWQNTLIYNWLSTPTTKGTKLNQYQKWKVLWFKDLQ